MGLLIEQERRAWKRQPQSRQRLDARSPYFPGLLFHAPLHPGWGMLDLVSGAPCTKTGLGTSSATPAGIMPVFGSGSYADFAAPAAFDGTLPFTIAWAQLPMSPASYSTVLDVRPPVNSTASFLIYLSAADSTYQFVVGPRDGGGNGKQAQFATGLQTNGRLDVFVLVAPSGMATAMGSYVLYRNGVRLPAAAAGPSFGNASLTGMRIGSVLGTAGDPFEGGIIGLTIWQRALDDRAAAAWLPEKLYSPRRTRRYIQLAGGASSYSITLTASTSAAAAIVKAAKLQRQASANAAAAIGKAAASSKAATATTTGQVKRAVSITRSATTALSAAVSTIKAKLLTLTATVSSSASVRRAVSITRSGTATSSASVRRAVAVVRSAASAAAAAVVKRTSSIKSATTTASGAISSLKAKLLTLVATVSTAASLTKGVRITRAAVSTVAALISRLFIAGTGGPPVFIPALRRLISASRGVLFTSPDRSVDLESPDRTNTLTSPRRDDT